jgi:hypothetical protein
MQYPVRYRTEPLKFIEALHVQQVGRIAYDFVEEEREHQ